MALAQGVPGRDPRMEPLEAEQCGFPRKSHLRQASGCLVREPPHPGLYSRNSTRRAIPDLQKPSLAHAHGRRVFPLVPLAPRASSRISRNYVQCWRACMLHTKQTTRCSPQAHQPTHTSPHFTMLGCRRKGVPEAALGLNVAPLQWPCPCTWSTSDPDTPSPSWAATLQPPFRRAPDGPWPPTDTHGPNLAMSDAAPQTPWLCYLVRAMVLELTIFATITINNGPSVL
jgi:hypothetical protein